MAPTPVYDDEKEKALGHHDDLGTHPERREAEVDDLENMYNAPSADDPQSLSRREAEGYAPDSSLPRRGGALPQRGGTLPQRKEQEALDKKTGLYRHEGPANTAASVSNLYDDGSKKGGKAGTILFGAGGKLREKTNNLSGRKKALLFGVGLGGGGLFLVVAVMIILFATLKIPNLAEHISSWQFARTNRAFRQGLAQVNAEKVAVDTATPEDYGKIRTYYEKTRSTTWGKLDKWRPGLTYKHMQATGLIDYHYTEFDLLGRQRIDNIRINGKNVTVDDPSFGKKVVNKINPLTPKADIILAAQMEANLDKALQDHHSLIRSSVAKKIQADLKIQLHWWDRQGKLFKGAKAAEADLLELNESIKRIESKPSEGSIARPIADAVNEADAAQKTCLKDPECAKKLLEPDTKNPTNSVSDIQRAKLLGEYEPTNFLSDESRAKLLGNIDNVKITAAQSVSTTVAIAMPLCIIYDGSVERSGGSVDAASASAERTYYGIASAADQQKAGETTSEAVGATNRKLGDYSSSIPEKRARNKNLPVSTDTAIASPEASAAGMFSLFGAIFGDEFGSKVDPIAEPLCGALTDWRVGLGVGAAEIALAIATGGGSSAAGATVSTGVKAGVGRVMSVVTQKLLSKKAIGRMLGETAAIAGLTVLAKMIVLSRMNAQNNGVAREQDQANIADAGGNLASNNLGRKMLKGRPMTQPEVAYSEQANRQYLAEKKGQLGIYERYFAMSNPDSLLVNMGVSLSSQLTNKKGFSKLFAGTATRFSSTLLDSPLLSSANPFNKQIALAQSVTDTNYQLIQWGWTEDELALIENDPNYFPLQNDAILEASGKKADIEAKYGACFTDSIGTLLKDKKIQRDEEGRIYEDAGICAPKKLGRNNPDGYGDLVFRWRISGRNNAVLDHVTDIQAPTNSDTPGATSAPPDGGLGVSPDGFTFPVKTTKTHITQRPRGAWCHDKQTSCHHHYNAADIFADPGTPVVAAKSGTVIYGKNVPTGGTGSNIAIMGDDKNVYWYGHLKSGSVTLTQAGQRVEAGTEIGQVGEDADTGNNSASHLHIDVQGPPATTREGCADQACAEPPFKFLDIQPPLIKAFAALPD